VVSHPWPISTVIAESGIPILTIADAVGVTRPAILSIVHGTHYPSVRTAMRVAKLFGLTVEEAFAEKVDHVDAR
jgi:DNA-binding XRE family transcriptional regulator